MKNLASLALAMSLLGPAAAQALTTEAVAVRVGHADLDLGQRRDSAVMLKRLDRAALTACGASAFSLREVQDEVRRSACYQQSVQRAVASIDAPALTAVHHDR